MEDIYKYIDAPLTRWEKVCGVFIVVLGMVCAVLGMLVCWFCLATAWYWMLLAAFIGAMAGAFLGGLIEMFLWMIWPDPKD